MRVVLSPGRCRLLAMLLLTVSLVAEAGESLRQRLEALHSGYSAEAAGERLMTTQALSEFYEGRGYELAWSDARSRIALLTELEAVAQDGLSPTDYHLLALRELMAEDWEQLSPAARDDLDLLLSDSFLLLGSHLLEGKVNPETIDPEWFANRRQRAMAPLLAEALANSAITATLEVLRPTQDGYRQLKAARARIAGLLGEPWTDIPAGPSIKLGMEDERVPLIRQRLLTLGDLEAANDEAAQSTTFDRTMDEAIAQFQRRHGLEDDGIVGRSTLAALNRTPQDRLQQIDLNLERWRWLPDSLGETYVLVNVAAFELKLVQKSQVKLSKRVIVGRPFRRTPVFSDQIRYLVFNPTWTVPRKLMVQDKLPEIVRDPDYIQRLGFSVYHGWGSERVQVEPQTVDWQSLSSRNFPYQLVQEPGPQNALGQVKFMFPNKFDVYLHDTPSRELFRKSERSFSSGCIRVHEPLDLAAALLELEGGWDRARIDGVVDSLKTTTVTLKQPIPVHLEYWTAWAGEDGRLQFRNDVYTRDARLYEALQASHTP